MSFKYALLNGVCMILPTAKDLISDKKPTALMGVPAQFHRLALLAGELGIQALQSTAVAVFGVGGVGSWCAESLVRSGVGKITLVDSDTVCVTNINRQLQATTRNIGRSKVTEMAARLREINPRATIKEHYGVYEASAREEFNLAQYDFVVDAIDSLTHKVDLIISATAAGAMVFTSMGAGNKLDPTLIRMDSIWNTTICPLAKLVRKKLREREFAGDCRAVYSLEHPQPIRHTSAREGSHYCVCAGEVKGLPGPQEKLTPEAKDWCDSKLQINASAVHITAIFGNYLAAMVIQECLRNCQSLEV